MLLEMTISYIPLWSREKKTQANVLGAIMLTKMKIPLAEQKLRQLRAKSVDK